MLALEVIILLQCEIGELGLCAIYATCFNRCIGQVDHCHLQIVLSNPW